LLAVFLALSAPTVWLSLPSVAQAAAGAKLRGSATYRERVALTPGAVFEAKLLDVSREDAPARTIAQIRRENPGQVPISFEIAYDPLQLDSRMRYVVRVSIVEERGIRFAGESAYSPPARGKGERLSILMHPVKDLGESEPLRPDEPATFVGILPCADCTGIRYQLNLLSDGAYMQRMTYLRDGHDDSFYELGRWSRSIDRRVLTLDGDRHGKAYWAVRDHETIRKLDNAGNPIHSNAPYDLKRRPEVDPMEPRLKMSGMFRYMADAPRFRECRSGLEWPVAMSDDYRDLERAYTKRRTSPGAEMLVSLRGRVEQRPRMEGRGTQAMLVVEDFLEATPGETCPGGAVLTGLEDSRWVPTRIGDNPVVMPEGQREPWIELDSRSKQATGSGGCNRMSGGYEAGEGTLSFGNLISTQMACPALEIETAFFRALERTRRYVVIHSHGDRVERPAALELMDAAGNVLARLEERNLR
jgi:copper homeostasis protein (lipoprotein)